MLLRSKITQIEMIIKKMFCRHLLRLPEIYPPIKSERLQQQLPRKLTTTHNNPWHCRLNQGSILFINKTLKLPRKLLILQGNRLKEIQENSLSYPKLAYHFTVHLTPLSKVNHHPALQNSKAQQQKVIISQPLAKRQRVLINASDHKSECQLNIKCWSQFKK